MQRNVLLAALLFATGLSVSFDRALAAGSHRSDTEIVAESSGETELAQAIAKWPTKESCIQPDSALELEPRWADFKTRADVWVCFYKMLSSMKSGVEMRQWLSQFDISLFESKRNDGTNILLFNCSKTNKKCLINWNTVDVVFPIFLKPYSFSFTIYERGGTISNFYVSANRE